MRKIALAVVGLVVSASSFATTAYDVTAVQASLTDVTSQILLVGIAVLTVFVGIKAYKWIRRAL